MNPAPLGAGIIMYVSLSVCLSVARMILGETVRGIVVSKYESVVDLHRRPLRMAHTVFVALDTVSQVPGFDTSLIRR